MVHDIVARKRSGKSVSIIGRPHYGIDRELKRRNGCVLGFAPKLSAASNLQTSEMPFRVRRNTDESMVSASRVYAVQKYVRRQTRVSATLCATSPHSLSVLHSPWLKPVAGDVTASLRREPRVLGGSYKDNIHVPSIRQTASVDHSDAADAFAKPRLLGKFSRSM
jgi:hypothetical protein